MVTKGIGLIAVIDACQWEAVNSHVNDVNMACCNRPFIYVGRCVT